LKHVGKPLAEAKLAKRYMDAITVEVTIATNFALFKGNLSRFN
jgi:hypothetical protein